MVPLVGILEYEGLNFGLMETEGYSERKNEVLNLQKQKIYELQGILTAQAVEVSQLHFHKLWVLKWKNLVIYRKCVVQTPKKWLFLLQTMCEANCMSGTVHVQFVNPLVVPRKICCGLYKLSPQVVCLICWILLLSSLVSDSWSSYMKAWKQWGNAKSPILFWQSWGINWFLCQTTKGLGVKFCFFYVCFLSCSNYILIYFS